MDPISTFYRWRNQGSKRGVVAQQISYTPDSGAPINNCVLPQQLNLVLPSLRLTLYQMLGKNGASRWALKTRSWQKQNKPCPHQG